MPHRPLTDAIFALAITTLLAASNAEGKEETNEWGREAGGVVGRATHYSRATCYDSKKQSTKCTKTNVVIVAGVLAGVFGIGVLWCLWLKWSDLRKRWKGTSAAAENESLSDGSETDSDCEKGILKGRKNKSKKSRDNSDFVVPFSPTLAKSEEASLSRSSSFSDLPSYEYDRPPGLTQPDAYPVAFPSYRMPSTRF